MSEGKIKRLICIIKGHDYYGVRKLMYNSMLVGCKRCGNFYGINHDVRVILPFSHEMYEMYKTMKLRGLKKYITNDQWFTLFRG